MKKQNLYYRIVFKRRNAIGEFVLNLFLAVSSWPKLVLEVFLRRNMGERYFSFVTCIVIAFGMNLLPFMMFGARLLFNGYSETGSNWLQFLWSYLTWFGFIGAFLWFANKRRMEVKRNPGVFDFKRFSQSTGDVNPYFATLKLFGIDNTPRTIETLYEPGFCLVVGLGLLVLGQMIGIVIVLCSVIYSLSYVGAHVQSDHLIMDRIDEQIYNEEMFNIFVEDKDSSQTRGTRVYGRKPASADLKRKVAQSLMSDAKDESFEVH